MVTVALAWLLRLARSPAARAFVGWVFATMSFALPVRRLRETPTLIAFYHPQPSYPLHILLVPKRARSALTDLTAADADFLADLVRAVNSLVEEFGLDAAGYRLIVNGGRHQDVPQLHFHLISDAAPAPAAERTSP